MELTVQGVAGGYGAQTIVHDISLQLQAGEWLSLVGANGSGKSTLLKLLSRVLTPQQGAVLLDGKAIHTQPGPQVARSLALLPQHQPLPAGLTVYQLISLGRIPHHAWWQWELTPADRAHLEWVLHRTQLQDFRDRPVAALSGGERQRAFLALALAQSPQVLLLDEPTTYLDVRHQLELLELLHSLNRERQLSILTVLHDLNLAARYSDRLALMRQGRLWALGPVATVLTADNLRQVFGLEALVQQTPVGLQVYPLAPANPLAKSRDGPLSVP